MIHHSRHQNSAKSPAVKLRGENKGTRTQYILRFTEHVEDGFPADVLGQYSRERHGYDCAHVHPCNSIREQVITKLDPIELGIVKYINR